jgi:hypothetical protein
MTNSLRVKFGLIFIASVLATTMFWNAAQGQNRRPGPGPNPGMRQPGGMGGMNPPGGGGMGINWRCPKCGHTGPGAVPPETCPGCGVHFINGIGNGSAGMFGNRGGGPPMNNPGFNPPSGGPGFVPNGDSSSEQTSSPKKMLLIALGVGITVVGVAVLTGGALLVFYSTRSSNSSPARRRPRRDDFDD